MYESIETENLIFPNVGIYLALYVVWRPISRTVPFLEAWSSCFKILYKFRLLCLLSLEKICLLQLVIWSIFCQKMIGVKTMCFLGGQDVTSSFRSSHPEMFLIKGVLKICSKFTGEHPCRSMISVKLLCNFVEITLRHGCPPINLLHLSRTPFPRNTSRWLVLVLLFFSSEVSSSCIVNARKTEAI